MPRGETEGLAQQLIDPSANRLPTWQLFEDVDNGEKSVKHVCFYPQRFYCLGTSIEFVSSRFPEKVTKRKINEYKQDRQ